MILRLWNETVREWWTNIKENGYTDRAIAFKCVDLEHYSRKHTYKNVKLLNNYDKLKRQKHDSSMMVTWWTVVFPLNSLSFSFCTNKAEKRSRNANSRPHGGTIRRPQTCAFTYTFIRTWNRGLNLCPNHFLYNNIKPDSSTLNSV